jgi:radical SAM superfamily enzyme YgiQ (UPF0313 family)
VVVFNFADENPTSSRARWKEFCEALIAENVPDVILVGSTRADDIVRDADLLHLYKKAGVQRWLLGMENTDEKTLALIKKNGTVQKDREAIRLLRQHGILSMATWVVGFEEETHRDYVRGIKQLLSYDPDQLQMLYVTPHRWTPYFRIAADRKDNRDGGRRGLQRSSRFLRTLALRWRWNHQEAARFQSLLGIAGHQTGPNNRSSTRHRQRFRTRRCSDRLRHGFRPSHRDLRRPD